MTKPVVPQVLMRNGHGTRRPDHDVGDIYRDGLSHRIHNGICDIIGAAEILAHISGKAHRVSLLNNGRPLWA